MRFNDDNKRSESGRRGGARRDGGKKFNSRERSNDSRGFRKDGERSKTDEGGFKPEKRNFNNSDDRGFNKSESRGFNKSENRNSDRSENRSYNKPERKSYDRSESKSFNPNFKKKSFNQDREFKPRFNRDENSTAGEERSFRPRKNFDSSYDPNAKYSKKKQTEFKKNSSNPNEPVRLNKFLANAGLCSRREADEYIKAGVVTVNGEVVNSLGAKVIPAKDRVLFHDQLVRAEKKIYLLLNKPKDCVTTTEDTNARLTVMDLVKNACDERIYPVGRLDRNTTGVLLLTNDGDLAAQLTHPKYNKKKIYQVTVDKAVTKADLEKIAEGFELEDGFIQADAVSYVTEDDKKQVGIEIHSGRNRIVRRIFEHLGYKVVRLDRVYFAGLTKKNLSRGQWRFLTDKELNILRMGAYE